jgi:hypothetical protein
MLARIVLLHFSLVVAGLGCAEHDGRCLNDAVLPEDEISMLQTQTKVSPGKESPPKESVPMQRFVDTSLDELNADPKKKQTEKKDQKKDQKKSQTSAPTAKPTVTYGTSKFGNAAKVTKIKLNSAGDLLLFIGALRVDVGGFFFMVFCFMMMHRYYPEMYCIRSTVGWIEEKERPKNQDGEVDEGALAKWRATSWTKAEINELKEWSDGYDEPEEEGVERKEAFLKTQELLAKKNNWPAPKSARFSEEDLVWTKASGWNSWWKASWGLNLYSDGPDGTIEAIGLDATMLLVFTEMAMKIMMTVGLPLLLLVCPMFIFFGGGAAKKDLLSWQGIGNVWYDGNLGDEDPSVVEGVRWIYWVVALAVWYVVITTQTLMFKYMDYFIPRRKRWLRAQPKPQNCTLLVEFLPVPRPLLVGKQWTPGDGSKPEEMYWTDTALQSYYESLFPGQIESAYVVKKASKLTALIDNYSSIACGLNEDHKGVDDLFNLWPQIQEAQEELENNRDNNPQDYYSVNGFVTFKQSFQRDSALNQRLSDTDGELETHPPPLPQDVIFEDLETDHERRGIDDLIGLALIAGLFFAFMPIVLAIGKVTSIKNIEAIPFVKSLLKSSGFENTIGGLLASAGLTLMMSFLPTFLMMIFALFANRSLLVKQLELQRWYFWFLVVFVLLVTAVGSDLAGTLATIARRPLSIFTLLADRMPMATHFYLSFVIMQPLTHGMNLTRYISIIKYWVWKSCGYRRKGGGRSEGARFKSEPEDQDYYGIGSRSARFAFILLVGLVFGTICPLMNIVCMWNFYVCRLVYGFLMPCCEQRKSDMGGDCFCQQIKHISESMVIYLILMVGILYHRAPGPGPAIISSLAFVPWLASYMRLKSKHWERLALKDVMIDAEMDTEGKKISMRPAMRTKYSQDLDEVYLKKMPKGLDKDHTDLFSEEVEKIWLDHYKSGK